MRHAGIVGSKNRDLVKRERMDRRWNW